MTLHDIESAVARLAPDELAKFRAWFVEFDADAWDRQIEEDANSGQLDALAEEALEDYRSGRTTEL
jgi:hypothetical protein